MSYYFNTLYQEFVQDELNWYNRCPRDTDFVPPTVSTFVRECRAMIDDQYHDGIDVDPKYLFVDEYAYSMVR